MKRLKNLMAVLAALTMIISVSGGIPAMKNIDASESLTVSAKGNTSADGLWGYNLSTNRLTGEQSVYIISCYSTETDIVIPAEIDGMPVTQISISFLNTSPTSISLPSTVESANFGSLYDLESVFVDENNAKYTSIDGILYNKDITELCYVPCKKPLSDFTIPESVTSIGDRAFSGYTDMTSFTIPNGITSIGSNAFFCCTNLTSIEIPDTVTSIGSSAFYGCRSLTSIEIPDAVTSIGRSTFYSCRNLTSIKIPDTVTKIGSAAFYGCSSLEAIEFNGELDYICADTFSETPWLTALLDENDFVVWNGFLIAVNSALKAENSIHIPDNLGITGLSVCLFERNLNLTSVEIPQGVKIIGNAAFSECSNLTSVNIPDSVEVIEDAAFSGCTSLTSIELPDSVTRIGGRAFYECSALEQVRMSANIQKFEEEPFIGTPWLDHEVKDNPLAIYHGTLLYVNSELIDGKLIIPDEVTTINDHIGAGMLDYVVIPASVHTISVHAFDNQDLEVYYAGSEEEWKAIEFMPSSGIDLGNISIAYVPSNVQYNIHYNYSGSEIVPGQTTPTEELKQGDANGDGDVDILDVIAVNKAILGKGSLTEAQLKAVDFNGNNKPDAEESLTLLKYIVGLITEFE